MQEKILKYLPVLFIVAIWFVFSSPFFLKELVPYPSLFQSNFFSPWSAYSVYEGPVRNNAMPDIITQIYPWREFTINSLKNGEIPLWNPYNFSGTPHLANFQSAPFFPFNILFFLPLEFIFSWSILVLLQPLFAGVGMYVFIRSLKLSRIGAVMAAISFMFCGFLTTWMGYATLGYAILFLPFALWGVYNYIESKKVYYGVIIALLILLSVFAGHFQTSVYFLGTLLGYIIFESLRHKDKKALIYLLCCFAFGVLLTLPQVLPSLEFYANSVREGIVRQIEVIPFMYIPTLVAPDFFGNPVTRNDWFGHYAEWSGYAGVIPLLLASFASMSLFRRDKRVLFFIILATISLLLAFQTPINNLIFVLKVPLFSTSAASRIIVLFSFSVAVLSAFGIDFLIKRARYLSLKRILLFLSICLLLLIALWSVPFFKLLPDSEKNLIAQSNLVLPTLIIIAFSVLISGLYIVRKKRVLVYVVSTVILLGVCVDMMRFSMKWMPFEPDEFVFKDVGVTQFYEQSQTVGRYLGEFSAENSVYYKLQTLGGYDPLYSARYGEFVKYVELGQKESGSRSIVRFPYNSKYVDKAINYLGVEYIPQKKSDDRMPWAFPIQNYPVDRFSVVYEDNAYRIFRNNQSYPRVFVVDRFIIENDDEKMLNMMFRDDIDLRNTAILEKDPGIRNNASPAANVKIVDYKNNSIDVRVDSQSNALLVLTDSYYPGWKAYIDDSEVEILRTNYAFRGIIVPEGRSTVRLVYEPDTFLYGIYGVIVGIGGLLGIAVYYKRYERKN